MVAWIWIQDLHVGKHHVQNSGQHVGNMFTICISDSGSNQADFGLALKVSLFGVPKAASTAPGNLYEAQVQNENRNATICANLHTYPPIYWLQYKRSRNCCSALRRLDPSGLTTSFPKLQWTQQCWLLSDFFPGRPMFKRPYQCIFGAAVGLVLTLLGDFTTSFRSSYSISLWLKPVWLWSFSSAKRCSASSASSTRLW